MAKRVQKKDYEKLTDANIIKVIELLNAEKPITKKEACDMLNIAYNTTRLNKIIEDFQERREYTKRRKEQNRGKAASDAEISTIIEDYLDGDSVQDIAKRLYRSPAFVKNIVERLGIPQRAKGEEKAEIAFLPDECVAEDFEDNEIVWSAVYHSPALVIHQIPDNEQTKYEEKYGCKCYQIYIMENVEQKSPWFAVEKGGFYAASAAYDLGKLKHLTKYGAKIAA